MHLYLSTFDREQVLVGMAIVKQQALGIINANTKKSNHKTEIDIKRLRGKKTGKISGLPLA